MSLNYWSFELPSYCFFLLSFTVVQSILAIDHHDCFPQCFLQFYYLVYFYPSVRWETPDNQDRGKVSKATCKRVGSEDFENTLWKRYMMFRACNFYVILVTEKPFCCSCGTHCVSHRWGHEIREITHSHLHWLQIEMRLSFPQVSPQK